MGAVATRPLVDADMGLLAGLFSTERTPRHCWCMAFCSTRRQFSAGWFGGGNARRFAAMAATDASPMGVLAIELGDVIGWCACGPRSRYAAANTPRTRMIRERPADEHASTWFVPCFFVAPGRRARGITLTLLVAAVELAGREGALAVEGWPLSAGTRRPADAFVGREEVFAHAGFDRVDRPDRDRVIMRRHLGPGRTAQAG